MERVQPAGARADQHGNRSIGCFSASPESSCSAVNPDSGWRQSGAISASGTSTNRRWCEPWVRQNKRSGINHLALIIEEIEIEHARCVSLAAHPAKLSLDHLQHREQVSRGKTGYQRRDRVDEPWLVRARYGLGSIPSRAGRDLDTFRFERNDGGCERIKRRAELRAGQIAADADQDHSVLSCASLCLTRDARCKTFRLHYRIRWGI